MKKSVKFYLRDPKTIFSIKMQSIEQQPDELDALVSSFASRCLISKSASPYGSSEGLKARDKSRPSSGNENSGMMRQRSVFTAGKVSL